MHCLIVNYQPWCLFGLSSLIKMVFPSWHLTSAIHTDAALVVLRANASKPVDIMIVHNPHSVSELETLLQHARQANAAKPVLSIVFPTIWDQATQELCERYQPRVCLCNMENVVVIIESIKSAASNGECRCHPQAQQAQQVSTDLPRAGNPISSNAPQLSPRQFELAELVMAGYANKEIAHRLDLSYGTVKNYMADLMRLLKVRSRLELAAHLRQDGFVSAPRLPG